MMLKGSSSIPFLEDLINIVNGIKAMINIGKKATSFYNTKSLADVTRLARVEPITVVSKDLITVEYLPDILSTLLNIFAAYYLQAAALSARVDKTEIIKTLDRLNPDRDSSGFLYITESIKDVGTLVLENYKYKLPVALEAEDINGDEHPDYDSVSSSSRNLIPLTEVSNLAVGKIIEVTFETGEKDKTAFTLPMSIRLVPAILSNSSVNKILTLKVEDNSVVERYHSWRAGRIKFIQDLIFCQDLIDEHKKALMNDEAGTYSEIISRVNSAKKYGVITGNPSLVSASNLFVISEEVAAEVEASLGGKLSNPNIRKKAFENTYAMIIVVVDREWQRITIYTRGISSSANYSIKDIKLASKGKGVDIADILKSFTAGSPPTF
jgi:hypothetical protein